jgi:hypothetical protein
MRPKQQLLDKASIEAAGSRYLDYPVAPLSYGTVRDFCDSFDNLRPLATANGDLKDLQRPWVFKAILSRIGARGGRLLEIGAGEPLVADLLRRSGHEVWVVDPYDGSGTGPTDFERFRRSYRDIRFIRDYFTESVPGLEPAYFDCIYSISALEHIPARELLRAVLGMQRFLKQDGLSIHAVDHVHRGRTAEEHLTKLRLMANCLGSSNRDLDRLLSAMSDDTDTYYLSAESYNRWRGNTAYDDFPMRVCVSIQLSCSASQLVAREDLVDNHE